MKNTIKGGKADKTSVEDIAKKFKVSVDTVKAQIKKGISVEMEHTSDKEKATEIAMDHISEFADYYDRLEKMEKKASKEWKTSDVTENTKTLIKRLIRENLDL
jgi:translation initiation factor 2 alpha subunit (eIF-2alpha)